MLRTRVLAYKKVTNNLTPKSLGYALSPTGWDIVDDQKLDYIYDDEPLGFEEDPMGSTTKMRAHDPLEEVDLGDGIVKRPRMLVQRFPRSPKIEL